MLLCRHFLVDESFKKNPQINVLLLFYFSFIMYINSLIFWFDFDKTWTNCNYIIAINADPEHVLHGSKLSLVVLVITPYRLIYPSNQVVRHLTKEKKKDPLIPNVVPVFYNSWIEPFWSIEEKYRNQTFLLQMLIVHTCMYCIEVALHFKREKKNCFYNTRLFAH